MPTKVLAVEWARQRIRVNAVGPAHVATEMTRRNIEMMEVDTIDGKPAPSSALPPPR